MHVLLAHERFLFRFGVDRVLILYGIGLKALGWTISVIANRLDQDVIETFADQVIWVPESPEYKDGNEFTLKWLEEHWEILFPVKTNGPDVIIVGGWPFVSSVPFWKKKGIKVVFSDHGVVPTTGYAGYHLEVLQKLQRLRRENMPWCDAVIAVSNFIRTSQSNPDAGDTVEKITVHNGADHMDCAIWQEVNAAGTRKAKEALENIVRQKSEGKKFVLSLGRWEEGNYKNCSTLFDIVGQIAGVIPDLEVGVLARTEDITIPPDLEEIIVPLDFPGDDQLQELMGHADLGLSVSLWEGFNLPLGEMQWLGRPVLAFAIGAHPEVIMHPWLLCSDPAEMARKSIELLTTAALPIDISTAAQTFRNKFTWRRSIARLHDELLRICATGIAAPVPFWVLMDVSNAARDPANSGVIRVTRQIARKIQDYARSLLLVWDEALEGYRFPTKKEYDQLGEYNGPKRPDSAAVSTPEDPVLLDDFLAHLEDQPAWLLFSETVAEQYAHKARSYAKKHGFKIAAVFHDSIALLRPELVRDEAIRMNHPAYMRGLAECDVILPNSHFSAACLSDFFAQHELKSHRIVPNQLPGELVGRPRTSQANASLSEPIKILCVSTLEPRKNHAQLIAACEQLGILRPDLDWRLILIGNKYAGAYDLADWIQRKCEENPNIQWLGIVDDETLHEHYSECTFTVYPSEIEGFGLPIMESIWHGKPCICHEQGVMAELAGEGGCLTTNVTDLGQLSETILRLATDPDLYADLVKQAAARSIKSWDEYLRAMIFAMLADTNLPASQTIDSHEKQPFSAVKTPSFTGKFSRQNKPSAFYQINEPVPIDADRIQKKRILVCSNFYPPHFIGGAELIAHYQAKEFCKQGHQVEVFAGKSEAKGDRHAIYTEDYEGIRVHRVVLTPEDFDLSREDFRKAKVEHHFTGILKQFQPDIIHFHNMTGLAPALLRVAGKHACFTALTVHDYWGFCHKNTLEKEPSSLCTSMNECHNCLPAIQLESGQQVPVSLRQSYLRYLFDSVDAIVSPSGYLARTYVRAGFPAAKMHVVWNGIDLDRFASVAKAASPDQCRFTFIGHFGRHKGLHVLLEALLYLTNRKKIRLNLVGDGEERRNLEMFVKEHGLQETIRFWGKVDNARIEEVLSQTDVLVLPSVWPENQPVSITEAMASRTPVIATNIGGIPELIEDSKSGMLFELGNSKQLAEKMDFLAANPRVIEELGEQAYRRIANFTYSKQIQRLLSVYQGSGGTPCSHEAVPPTPLVAMDFAEGIEPVAEQFLKENVARSLSAHFVLAKWLDAEDLPEARFAWLTGASDHNDRLAQYLQAHLPILVPASDQKLVELCEAGNCGLYYRDIEELEVCLELLLDHPAIAKELGRCAFTLISQLVG